jgi:hypothetical protein
MKKLLISLLLIALLPNKGNSQSLQWERVYDLDIEDGISNLHLVDTSEFFASAYSDRFRVQAPIGFLLKPLLIRFNSSGYPTDTIVFQDTTFYQITTLDRRRKRLWRVFRNQNSPFTQLIFEKINFRGFSIVRRDFRGNDRIDSLPSTIFKLLPAADGGFYLLGGRNRRVGTQNTEPWQVSRFDSLGNRKWVREYLYTFNFGNPTAGEFLPNGNLFVSGWAGREIYGLEIDTATGNMVNRKVFFTHPENVGWAFASVVRSPGGYFVTGADSRNNPDTRSVFARVIQDGDSLRLVWGGLSTNVSDYPNALADSSIWVYRITFGGNATYIRYNSRGEILQSVLISNQIQGPNNYTLISSIGHFNDQSAIFGGTTQRSTTQGTALYFCKIDSIGTPYNPVYPPVGPVLTSNQRQNQEPNLQVYPNPFTNTLRLSHKGNAQLLDVHGRVIISQPVEAGEELKVGNLPKGMYLLRLQSVGGKLYVRKVVRE